MEKGLMPTTTTYNDVASELVRAVCVELGVEPRNARSVHVGLRSIDVEVYDLNEEGSKFIADDGRAAITVHTLQFRYE